MRPNKWVLKWYLAIMFISTLNPIAGKKQGSYLSNYQPVEKSKWNCRKCFGEIILAPVRTNMVCSGCSIVRLNRFFKKTKISAHDYQDNYYPVLGIHHHICRAHDIFCLWQYNSK